MSATETRKTGKRTQSTTAKKASGKLPVGKKSTMTRNLTAAQHADANSVITPRHNDTRGAGIKLPASATSASTAKVLANLKKAGLGPKEAPQRVTTGHRTKNRRPVQVNLSHATVEQMNAIRFLNKISITDQVIAALEKCGYDV